MPELELLPIKEAFPYKPEPWDDPDDPYFSMYQVCSEYDELVTKGLPIETVLWKNDNDYQGDSFALFRTAVPETGEPCDYCREKGRDWTPECEVNKGRPIPGHEWGYLNFGWGSCSGCDALQACDSYEDLDSLRKQLVADIHWEPSAGAMLAWLAVRDWPGQHSWYGDGALKEFLPEAAVVLMGAIVEHARDD